MKVKQTFGVGLLLASLLLVACGHETDVPDNIPYERVAELVSIADNTPEDIYTYYTETGTNMLRMAFPDANHRQYAVTQIGLQAPDITFSTLSGDLSLRDLTGKKVMLNISSTTASVTEQMASELEKYTKEADDTLVINFYPNDTEEEVIAFHEKAGYALDKKHTIAGEGSKEAKAIVEAFGSEYVPTLLYIDETGTISYVSIGFRDAILLQDNDNMAFGEEKLYTYLIGYEEGTTQE